MALSRSKSEIEKHRRRISELYLKGMLQEEIAAEIGISQPTVSRDLKAIQKVWQKETLFDFNEAKSRELERVDILEREYWQAWERSCEDAETVKQKGKAGQGKPDNVERTIKGQAGDPRFLQGVQWCIERRCKILGIDAPAKLEHSGTLESKLVILPPNE
jgi:hypothetical protein